MTEQEAIDLYESGAWKGWSSREKVLFQLFEDRLCMPFNIFHAAIEEVLQRPVWTHEFALNRLGLQREFLGESDPPTLEQIINLIPKDKRIIIAQVDKRQKE